MPQNGGSSSSPLKTKKHFADRRFIRGSTPPGPPRLAPTSSVSRARRHWAATAQPIDKTSTASSRWRRHALAPDITCNQKIFHPAALCPTRRVSTAAPPRPASSGRRPAKTSGPQNMPDIPGLALFGFWRRMMRSLQEKCLGEISDSRREKEKEKQEARRAVTNEVASNPFEKVAPAGRPIYANIANENQDPYDQAYWGKGKGKKWNKAKSKFQYPYDGNKGYPSYDSGKGTGGHDKGTSNTFAATAENLEEQPANQQITGSMPLCPAFRKHRKHKPLTAAIANIPYILANFSSTPSIQQPGFPASSAWPASCQPAKMASLRGRPATWSWPSEPLAKHGCGGQNRFGIPFWLAGEFTTPTPMAFWGR